MSTDNHFLTHALRLAAQGLGRTWPNPSVGCVLVKNNEVIAEARTADMGRPHAEAAALAIAGNAARGATAYVTLEPCAHHGKTPPCAQALIEAGIARVVYTTQDPDPRVAGRGVAMLRAAGIAVDHIPMREADALNRGFFRRVQHGLPHVAMKLATSRDNFLSHGDGKRQWITGEFARAHGNALRAQYDAILTGIGTVLADDPQLTVRGGAEANPFLVRVIADRNLRLPLTSTLVRSAEQQPVWLITSAEAVELNASHATELREAGVTFLVVEDKEVPPKIILETLAAEGITRLLIEAGSQLSSAFLEQDLVETLHWYKAPTTLQNAGKAAITVLDSVANGAPEESRALGIDTYERYEIH